MKTSHLAFKAISGGALHARHFAASNARGAFSGVSVAKLRAHIARIAAITVCSVSASFAIPVVSLAWNANPESDIAGYRLNYGTQPGVYAASVNTTAPAATVSGLTEGATYYFSVSAINRAGAESPASAEISHRVTLTPIVPADGWTLSYADSQESADFQAANAFDGDPGTIWHTAWSGTPTPPPHEIQINLGANQSFSGFRYLPRIGSFLVGTVGNFEFYVSQDGLNWGNPVATGTFASNNDLKEVRFTETTGRYIRFRGLTDVSGGTFMSVAELSLIQGLSTPPANRVPVAVAKSVATPKNTPVQVTLSGTDADGDSLTYALLSNPANGTLGGTAPNLTYSPQAGFTGNDSFTYRVNDRTLDSASATVSITVSAVNEAPVATPKSVTVTEDTPVAIVLEGSDANGNSLTFTTVSGPARGTLSGNAPNLTYTPAANYNGSDTFTFRVNDGTLNSATATVSITVTAVNDAPVALSKSVSTPRGIALPITIAGTDVDGNPLTYTVLTQPANGTLGGTPPNLTYQPVAGYSGNDQFTFRVHDGLANSATATVSIVVTPPVAPAASVISRTGWSLKYVDSQELYDAPGTHAFDGNPATFWHTQWRTGTIAPQPHEIQINLGAVHSINGFRYLPRQDGLSVGNIANYEFYVSVDGTDWGSPVATGTFANSPAQKQIVFTPKTGRFVRLRSLSEVNGLSDTCVAELNILAGNLTNQAPLATAKSVVTEEDSPLAISLAGSDPDGSPLTFSVVSAPSNGSLSGTPPNLTYVPATDFHGPDQFTFRVNDGAVFSVPATVSITVTPVVPVLGNSPPVFTQSGFNFGSREDAAFTGQLTAIDPNPGDSLTFRKISGPAWLSVSPTGEMSGTPLNPDVGTASFTVKVSDPSNASATTAVQILVENTNDAPGFSLNPLIYPAATEKALYRDQSVAATASDPDRGDFVTYSKVAGPQWLTVERTGTLGGTPPAGAAGSNSFTIRATDSAGAFGDTTLEIRVNSNTLPLPWTLYRVGTGNIDGAANYSAGTFTVAGAGSLAPDEDSGNFGWQTLSGDGEITARVSMLGETGSGARAGVMIRESLAEDSRQVFLGVDESGSVHWLRRATTGGESSRTVRKPGKSGAAWLRLVRKGGTITASRSADGKSWSKVGAIGLTLPKNGYIGLSVSSGDDETLNTSQFNKVRVKP